MPPMAFRSWSKSLGFLGAHCATWQSTVRRSPVPRWLPFLAFARPPLRTLRMVPSTEMATILSVRSGGRAIFFSMATSFTAAALGAEGLGKDVEMLIGNGFVPGHAELTIGLLRKDPGLRKLFERR